MKQKSAIVARAMVLLAPILGGTSLLLFGVFLLRGSFHMMDFGLGRPQALLFDSVLCLVFFVQHSVMIRPSFHRLVHPVVPTHYRGAVYAISSALVLFLLLILWQRTPPALITLGGPLRWLAHGLFMGAIAGFMWGVRALRAFDAFGTQPIIAHLRGSRPRNSQFTVAGPYRWVRHPLYLSALLLIWSSPEVTADRLLFNAAWTVWIVIGTVLEERDLVALFGAAYVDYQRRVPMLIPLRFPRGQHQT